MAEKIITVNNQLVHTDFVLKEGKKNANQPKGVKISFINPKNREKKFLKLPSATVVFPPTETNGYKIALDASDGGFDTLSEEMMRLTKTFANNKEVTPSVQQNDYGTLFGVKVTADTKLFNTKRECVDMSTLAKGDTVQVLTNTGLAYRSTSGCGVSFRALQVFIEKEAEQGSFEVEEPIDMSECLL